MWSGLYWMKHGKVVRNVTLSFRIALSCGVCIVPCKNSPQVQCLCIVKLVSKSTVGVVPWEACEENPSLHPQRESYCCSGPWVLPAAAGPYWPRPADPELSSPPSPLLCSWRGRWGASRSNRKKGKGLIVNPRLNWIVPIRTISLEFIFMEVQGPRCKCVFLYCIYLAKTLKNHNKS